MSKAANKTRPSPASVDEFLRAVEHDRSVLEDLIGQSLAYMRDKYSVE